MSGRGEIDQEADNIERRYEEERLMLERRGEEFEVIESVFDRLTLEGVFRLIRRKVIDRIHGVVKAGKEARVYWGVSPDNSELAIKIYYTATAEFRRGMMKYIDGDPRFRRVRKDLRSIIYTWTQKEFKNLQLAQKAKVRVPKPIAIKKNVLIMKFIGKDGNPAPELKELPPKKPEVIYNELLEYVRRLYHRAKLVHGDISEYNVMVWRGKPILFDMAQALPLSHPLARTLLKRDLENLHRYFKKLGVEVPSVDEMCRIVTENGEP